MLETLQVEIERLNRELAIDPSGYALPNPVIPRSEITVEPDGKPLIDSAWSWSEQSRRLIASKAYNGAGE